MERALFIHTCVVLVSSWTMEQEGSKHVAVAGATDKRQITAVFCGTTVREFLPVQLIYAGKTTQCHTKFQFPSDWLITHSQSISQMKKTMLDYIDSVIFPYMYVRRVRYDLGVGPEQAALAIFDHFRGQMTDNVIGCLERHNINSVLIPTCCTDKLQPMDVSVNRAAKALLEREFQHWRISTLGQVTN